MKKIIKKHKWTFIIVIAFIVFMIITSQVLNLVLVNSGKPVYGDRLDGIKRIEISKTNILNLENGLKENPKVQSIKYSLHGKVIGVKIILLDDVTVADAKVIGTSVLEYFDTEQKSNYGIEVYLIKNVADEKFPIMGYKHYTKENLSWTKER